MKKNESVHELLIQRGLRLHSGFRYRDALPFFKEAFRASPKCPAAIYNLANTLHMLDQSREACKLLSNLVKMDDSVLAQGCPTLRQPKGFRTDAHYLMFHALLHWKGKWEIAYPYALKHLQLRRSGVKSAWRVADVRKEITELKSGLRPKS